MGNLPVDKIREDHLAFIQHALQTENLLSSSLIIETFLPRFIEAENKALVLGLLKIILEPIRTDGVFQKFTSIIPYTYLHYNIEKLIPGIVSACGLEAFYLLHDYLNIELNHFKDDYIWQDIPTVAFNTGEDQDSFEKFHRLLVKIMAGFLKESNEDVTKEIKNLTESEWPLFKRIAIHLIDAKFIQYRGLLFILPYNPFIELDSHTELSCLIENQATNFTEEELGIILSWLEEYKSVWLGKMEGDVSQDNVDSINNTLHRWLNSLSPSNNPQVLSKLEEYKKLDVIGIESISTDSQPGGWLDGQKMDVEAINALSKKTIAEIGEYLNLPQEPNGFGFIDYSQKEHFLGEYIKSSQDVFFDNWKLFADLPLPLCRKVVDVVSFLWKNNNEFHNWENFFQFLDYYTSREEFKVEINHGTIITIGRFLRDATSDDQTAFPIELMAIAKNIVLKLLSYIHPEIEVNSDLQFEALNRSYSILLTTLVIFSLRIARVVYVDKSPKWDADLKVFFDDLLKNNPSIELHYNLGTYFGGFLFLDKEWVTNNWKLIFPEDEQLWKATYHSYIFAVRTLYIETYKTLKENGELIKAVDDQEFILTQAGSKLIGHICIAYTMEIEKIGEEGNLIERLLASENPKVLHNFVYEISRNRHIPFESPEQIKVIWEMIIKKINDNIQETEYQSIAGALSGWAKYTDIQDDEFFEWLKISAEYINLTWRRKEFYEFLLSQISHAPQRIGILVSITANTDGYIHGKEELIEIVTYLYENSFKELADEICDRFGKNGFQGLAATYNSYNKIV